MGIMPYPLEKGLFPLAVEQFFNQGLDQDLSAAGVAAILGQQPGPMRRLRAIWRYREIADRLRAASQDETTIAAVTADNSFVHSSIFDETSSFWGSSIFGDAQPEEIAELQGILAGLQRTLAERWFGMTWDPAGGPHGGGGWKRRPTTAWSPSASLGHWSGYYGNAELILCETLQRMLEVSLGLDHQDNTPKPEEVAGFESDLRNKATRVWPVYMFLTCPQPWFGAWITWQCHAASSPLRGQVTVLVQTPGHERPITPSPVDREGDTPQRDVGGVQWPNPYFLHGRETANRNSGYDGPYVDASGNRQGGDPQVAGPADQGMWLVTHENHDSTIVWESFGEPPPGATTWPPANGDEVEAWELPPIATYRCATLDQRADLGGSPSRTTLDGYYDIVVVSPASRDGGVPSVPLFH